MAAIRAFIFDMDGTIVDNMPFHIQTWLELLAAEGVALDAHAFHRQTAGQTTPEILRRFIGGHLTEAELAAYAYRKESLYRELYRPHLRALDGLLDFLRAARRLGLRLALATASGDENIAFVLGGIEATGLFDVVVSGDEVERGKPEPEMFLLAAERMGVPPEACLVFEDAPAGIEAARRAGMRTVVVTTTLSQDEVAGRSEVLHVVPDFRALDPAALIDEAPAR